MTNVYTSNSVDNFISEMEEKGWEAIHLSEGVLTSGDWALLSPDDKHYNFVIREKYLNEWSSGQTVRKCAKVSAALQAEIDRAMEG